jgi:preprotein translocase subunit SecF
MNNIIKHKFWYFVFSLVIIIPGLLSLLFYGLNLSIDFTGGSQATYLFTKSPSQKSMDALRKLYTDNKIFVASVQQSGTKVFVKSAQVNEKQNKVIVDSLTGKIDEFKQEEFASIGPTIGKELTQKAFYSILVSSLLIMGYIAFSFRKVPKPTSSIRFGVCTIAALLHDVLLLLGVFSLLGHFLHVEVDSLFVTAVLTVIGFSVHDTIVVFDRIRENLLRGGKVPFETVVNDSILQTLIRSLSTSLTALLVLFTLVLFGGDSIRWFVIALLIGIASGTYSSIFNAAPLLVLWQEFDERRKKTV